MGIFGEEEPLRIFSCDTKALLLKFFEFGKLLNLMSKTSFVFEIL